MDRLDKAGVKFTQEIPSSSSGIISVLLAYVLPFIILYGIFFFVIRSVSKGGGMMGVGKSTAKMYVQKETVFHLKMWQVRRRPRSLCVRL